MTFRKSIRWRIQAWHGLLLLAMTAAFGVTAYRLEKANAYRRLDDDLQSHLGLLTAALERGKPPGGEGGERPPPPPRGERPGPPPGFRAPEIKAAFSPGEPD